MFHGPHFTHLALRVRDVNRTALFYSEWANLEVVHDRVSEASGMHVVWLAERGRKPTFVFVLLELPFAQTPDPPVDHLGFAVARHDDVDRIAARARDAGILIDGPVNAGPIVGYYCTIADPDGHHVEFSWGQAIDWE